MSRLVAVIVNWETPDYTIRSAQALIADGVPAERIIVVDNGSADDSYERFQEALPRCRLLRLEKNVGFGRAMNAGARTLDGTSYLLVNNDAFVNRPGSVRELLAALEDKSVGVAVPRVLNTDLTLQPSVVPMSSPGVALVRASGLSRLIPNRWQPRWSTHWNHACAREIYSANGAVMLIRDELWLELGGFDERIFMYSEELDLFWRARKLGWRLWFTPAAEFVHIGNASSGRHWESAERAEMVSRSESAMIRRHQSPLAARLTLFFMAAGLAARRAVYRIGRKREAVASLNGYLRGISRR